MRYLFLVLLCAVNLHIGIAGANDSLLQVLDKTIVEHSHFEEAKVKQIEALKGQYALVNTFKNHYLCTTRLIDEYATYSYDSAIFYVNKNLALLHNTPDFELLNETYLTFADLLASTGRYHEAFDVLKLVDRGLMSHAQLEKYYSIDVKLYSELSFYNMNNAFANGYKLQKQLYSDSLLGVLAIGSEKALALEEAGFRDERQLDRALEMNAKRLKMCHSGMRSYSLITFERSLLHEMMGQKELQIECLALSAISDIESMTKDNISLTRLARLFYEQGEIDRAYRYIRYSFDDAAFYKSRLRYVQINNILPLITKAYQQKSEAQNRVLYKMILALSLVAFVLLLAILFIIIQYKKLVLARKELQTMNGKLVEFNTNLTQTNSRLTDSNLIKEQYIGEFLETCFGYIEKLDSYRKMVNKHVVNRQITELFDKTKSGQMLDDELANFYQTFDSTFLKLYPNFVEQFNSLLIKEEQIELKKGGKLNIELRIFALIRLGITDSATIARLLRYSIHTIYNYRAKMRSIAVVPRDDFEARVMTIGVHQ